MYTMISPDGSMARDCYRFFDTQVVSYAFKGIPTITIHNGAISSIVASEFLLLQGNTPIRANYYIPMPRYITSFIDQDPGSVKRLFGKRPFNKRYTDSVTMPFDHKYQTIIQYSNYAIADVINNRRVELFYMSIQHLKKDKRKTIRKRFQFLLDNELWCLPLNQEIIDQSRILLEEFKEQHNVKANFRNSWNDMLILATALSSGTELVTKDNELSRFVAERYAQSFRHEDQFINLSFEKIETPLRRSSRESKGYINRGWNASFYYYK
jgi:predicted nucleic acid-binding protein